MHLNEYADAFRSWEWLQDKILPTAGGYEDQSPVWIEIMEIIRSVRPA